jgi:subtilase family serine protease/endonuclease/exonuclease/phosphatase family metal-dependent hydrolase
MTRTTLITASLLAITPALHAYAADGADLVVTGAKLGAATVAPGAQVLASGVVSNPGTATAGTSRLKYFLSTDSLLDATDRYLNYDDVDALAPGASNAESANLRIPASLAPGSYIVLLVADSGQLVPELDETNNLAALPVVVGTPTVSGMDLAVNDAVLSTTKVDPGQSLTASGTVRNVGIEVVNTATQLGYYLSTDPVLDASDPYLNYDAVGALAPGAGEAETANVTVPAGTIHGVYYVLLVADRKNGVVEADEKNNLAALELWVGKVGPDLRLGALGIGAEIARPGDAVPVTAEVSNGGLVASPESRLVYMLSRDLVLDAADSQLSFDKVDVLAPGASSLEDAPVRLDPSTSGGAWYILLVVDPDQTQIELDETNNLGWLPLTVLTDDPTANKPDLVATASSLDPAASPAGGTVVARTVVKNLGTSAAVASRLKYFFSKDALYDDTDSYINYDNVDPLAAGAESPESASIPIPATLADGTYYVLWVVDQTREVSEQYESNNVVALALQVGPKIVDPEGPPCDAASDLVVSQAALASTAVQAGCPIGLSCTVTNLGGAAAAPTRVKYFLSADQAFNVGDKYLGYDNVGILAPNGTSPEDATPGIPASWPHGSWFILVVADAAGEVSECEEANNLASVALEVQVDQPDADLPDLRMVQAISANKASVAPNGHLAVTGLIENTGTQTAAASRIRIYLSQDALRSQDDRFLGYREVGELGPTESEPFAATLRIPADAAPGAYQVLFVLDAKDEIVESYESDNLVELPVQVGQDDGPVLSLPWACPAQLAPDASLPGLSTVATLNALHLGWTNRKDYPALACVVSHFDVIGLLEIDAPQGLLDLEAEVEAMTGEPWSSHVSEHDVGHESGKEFYGFLWRTAEAEMTAVVGFYPDPGDLIKREPYGASFKLGSFDFTLVVYHLRYGTTLAIRRAEAGQLDEVYDYFQAANGTEQDVLLGGDFNLPGNDAAFTVVGHDGVTYITDPEQKTSIGLEGLTSSFDNIFYSADHTGERLFAGAYDYTNQNWGELRETVSDHIPVWMAVDSSVDDD